MRINSILATLLIPAFAQVGFAAATPNAHQVDVSGVLLVQGSNSIDKVVVDNPKILTAALTVLTTSTDAIPATTGTSTYSYKALTAKDLDIAVDDSTYQLDVINKQIVITTSTDVGGKKSKVTTTYDPQVLAVLATSSSNATVVGTLAGVGKKGATVASDIEAGYDVMLPAISTANSEVNVSTLQQLTKTGTDGKVEAISANLVGGTISTGSNQGQQVNVFINTTKTRYVLP